MQQQCGNNFTLLTTQMKLGIQLSLEGQHGYVLTHSGRPILVMNNSDFISIDNKWIDFSEIPCKKSSTRRVALKSTFLNQLNYSLNQLYLLTPINVTTNFLPRPTYQHKNRRSFANYLHSWLLLYIPSICGSEAAPHYYSS